MCGRYTLQPGDKFYDRFDIENRLETLVPRYNIAPGQMVPVVISKSPNRVMIMRWGLIPHWAKEQKIGYKMINARIETIKEKPSYRTSLKNKRCLVPASGYYEWQKVRGGKVPHFIHEKDDSLFGFAGLYDVWKDERDREIYTFTIITKAANKFMESIHDRMPVVLDHKKEKLWLDKNIENPDDALMLVKNDSPDNFEEYIITTAVNKPENDSPSIITPIRKL